MGELIKRCLLKGTDTQRLRMRPLKMGDVQDMFEYTSDEKTCSLLRWGPHRDISQTGAFLQKALAKAGDPEDIDWGIYLKEDSKLIGAVHVYAIDLERKCADISYILNRAYTGQGYMTECIGAVISAVKECLGLQTVYADFVEGNAASERVMLRCGMTICNDVKPWKTEVKGRILKTYRYETEAHT